MFPVPPLWRRSHRRETPPLRTVSPTNFPQQPPLLNPAPNEADEEHVPLLDLQAHDGVVGVLLAVEALLRCDNLE